MPDNRNPMEEMFRTETETARRVDSEEYQRIYGRPWWLKDRQTIEAEQAKKTADAAFYTGLAELIEVALRADGEARQLPSAEALAAAVGCSESEAASWLADFQRDSFEAQRHREAELQQRRVEAEAIVRPLRERFNRAVTQWQEKRRRRGGPLPHPDVLQDPGDRGVDRLVDAVLDARQELQQVQMEHMADLSYMPPVRYGNSEADRRYEVERGIVDKVVNLNRCLTAQTKAEENLRIHAVQQLESAKQGVAAAYGAVLAEHVRYWKLSGSLCTDVVLPERPEAADGAELVLPQTLSRPRPEFSVNIIPPVV